jgi:glutathione synthase
MVKVLQKGGQTLASYILMQRIRPPVQLSTMVRKGRAVEEECVSELGIYGAFVKVGDEVKMNECCGHLLRTKSVKSDEGGIAAGYAVLDSLYLTE